MKGDTENRSRKAKPAEGRVASSPGKQGKRSVAKAEDLGPRDRVIRDVVRGLYEGRFEPGQRLVEAQLTEDYGVSRGPVREALNRLAAMGVVDLMPQRGAQIRVLSIDDAIESLIVVQGLVGIAARLAAERIEEGGAEQLQATVEELERFDQTSASADYAKARDSFYATLTRIAGNPALSRIMMRIDIHLIRIQFRAVLRTVDRRRHRDYVDIASAVLAGDAKRAERLAKSHVGRSITALENFRSGK